MGKIVALGAFDGSPDGLGASALGVTQYEHDRFRREFNERVARGAAGSWPHGVIPMGPTESKPTFAARNPLTCAAANAAKDWTTRPYYTKVMLEACSAAPPVQQQSVGWFQWLLGQGPVLDPSAISKAMEDPGLSATQKAQLQAQLLQAQQIAQQNAQNAIATANALAEEKARRERMLKTALVVALVAGAVAIIVNRRRRQ